MPSCDVTSYDDKTVLRVAPGASCLRQASVAVAGWVKQGACVLPDHLVGKGESLRAQVLPHSHVSCQLERVGRQSQAE